MGSRKLPKMVRGIRAPAGLLASMAMVARAGIGFTTVICARLENAVREATEMHNTVRKDDIRRGPERWMSANTRRRPVCVNSARIAKDVPAFALFCDTEVRNVGGFRCASDRKDGWAEATQPRALVDHK